MNRIDLDSGMNGREVLDADESKIANLLGTLPRVEAPANFEFGVRAKIAAGGRNSKSTLLPFLKVAAPLSLVLIVGAVVMFYVLPGGRTSNDVMVAIPSVPQTPKTPSGDAEVAQSDTRSEPSMTGRESGPSVAEERPGPKVSDVPRSSGPDRVQRRAGNSASTPDGGSILRTQRQANVISPPGISPIPGSVEMPVEDLLQILGVKADLVGRDWVVRSTTENSLAARAGVRPNDVIEAIDDLSLTAKRTIKGLTGGKSCQVRRDGKQLKLDLRK